MKSMFCPQLIVSRWVQFLILILVSINFSMAHEGEEIYRTGLEASKGWFAISPDGYLIVFETGLPSSTVFAFHGHIS